eukprot:TRINITY_DN8496_c0_g1_i1.p1 TRINITY_DN8496_c0_g1~~TRINITY_DN8496_c0_g1_i1.p1  ORF type:complete len:848 (+),score=124.55 TRINITY_DN8496_c0_g1_i1:45-2546(+)
MSHFEIDSASESDDDKGIEFPEVRNEDSEDDEEDSETESSDSTSSAGTMPAIEGHDDKSLPDDGRSVGSIPARDPVSSVPVDNLFGQASQQPTPPLQDSPTVRTSISPDPQQRNSRRMSVPMRSPSLTSVGSERESFAGEGVLESVLSGHRGSFDGMPPLPRTTSIDNRDHLQSTLAQGSHMLPGGGNKGGSSLSSTASVPAIPFIPPQSIPTSPPHQHKDMPDDEDELHEWDLVNSIQRNLKASLRRQSSLVKQSDKFGVEILRLIVHSLQSRPNMTDVVSAIRREAQSRGMPLLLNPDVLIAGKEKGGFEATELYTRVQKSLSYLPSLDTNPWGFQDPWPTNNFWTRVVPLTSPRGTSSNDKEPQFVTITSLIDHLLLDDINAGDYPFVSPIRDNFTNRFFLVHLEFITPDALFSSIARFYNSIPSEYLNEERFTGICVRVLKVLDYWIRHSLVDFPEQLLLKARSFVAYIHGRRGAGSSRTISKAISSLSQTVERSLSMGTPRIAVPKQIVADEDPPDSKLDGVNGHGIIGDIHGLNHEEVARQMCLLAYENFSQISIRQFFNSAWNIGSLLRSISSDYRIASERIAAYREWIASQIIRGDTPEMRLATIHHFINIARHCLALQNLTAAQAIYSGISHNAVIKLKRTIGDPPGSTLNKKRNSKGEKSEYEIFKELDFDPFKKETSRVLKKAIESNKPCLPDLVHDFSGYFMRCYESGGDSVTIRTNPDDTTTELINWKKMVAISQGALMILIFQSRPYNFKPVPQIQDLLINLPGRYPDEVLGDLAEQKEPPLYAPAHEARFEDPESEDSRSDSPKSKWGKMKRFFKKSK